MKNRIVIIILFSLLALGWLTLHSAETVPQTQTVLKSYFQNGSVPNSTNYAELIDTMFYYIGQMSSNSAVLSSNSAVLLNTFQAAPALDCSAIRRGSTWYPTNCTITSLGSNNWVLVTLPHVYPTTNYYVKGSGSLAPTPPDWLISTTSSNMIIAFGGSLQNFTYTTNFGVYSNNIVARLFDGANFLPYP